MKLSKLKVTSFQPSTEIKGGIESKLNCSERPWECEPAYTQSPDWWCQTQ